MIEKPLQINSDILERVEGKSYLEVMLRFIAQGEEFSGRMQEILENKPGGMPLGECPKTLIRYQYQIKDYLKDIENLWAVADQTARHIAKQDGNTPAYWCWDAITQRLDHLRFMFEHYKEPLESLIVALQELENESSGLCDMQLTNVLTKTQCKQNIYTRFAMVVESKLKEVEQDIENDDCILEITEYDLKKLILAIEKKRQKIRYVLLKATENKSQSFFIRYQRDTLRLLTTLCQRAYYLLCLVGDLILRNNVEKEYKTVGKANV